MAVVSYVVDEAWVLGSVEDVVFDGDDSCFLSFAGDDEFVFVPVDVVEFEVAEFADAHPGVGEKIDDGFGSFTCSASVAAAQDEVDVVCCRCLDGFFVSFVGGEGVVDVSEFAPGVECLDVVVELVSFGSVFYSFREIVVGLVWLEVDEVDAVFFEVDEFSYAFSYGGFWVVVESGEHEAFEVFPGLGVNSHVLQFLTEM